jgi:CHAD domain-containing protein
MSGSTIELVLAIEATAASEWMAGPAASKPRGRAAEAGKTTTTAGSTATSKKKRTGGASGANAVPEPADIGAALAGALSRMPGLAEISPLEESTVRAFVELDGQWRVMLAATGDGARRITAARATELTPGLRQCETVCDQPLDAGAPLAFSDVLPQALAAALGKPDKLAPSPALAVRRGVWRWSGPDGAVVDVELHDAHAAFERADDAVAAPPEDAKPAPAAKLPIAFCELRLVSRIADDRAATPVAAPSAAAGNEPSDVGETSTSSSSAHAPTDARYAAVQALFAAAAALTDTLPVFAALADGYARACTPGRAEAPVRAAHIHLAGVKTPHDALIDVGANVARQWLGNEAGVRDSTGADADTEYVHQMRVALRRLKTLLKTFPRWADDTWERTIVPELRWLAGLLGEARDLDVFVDATLPTLAEADIDAPAWASLQARAAARRDEVRARVRAALRTRRYAALTLALLRWLAVQRFTAGPSGMEGKPLADYAAKRVRKHFRRLVAKPELTALTPAQRHHRRIEAKRLRYTLEFFQPLASGKTRRKIAKQLGRIQSVLGDGNDATAALAFLEALDVPAYQHGFARGWCEAVNRWTAAEAERLLQALGKPKIGRAP